MPAHAFPVLPDSYRLLSRFSGVPTLPIDAYKAAGMYQAGFGAGVSVEHMQVMRRLVQERLIRWTSLVDPNAPRGLRRGYVLTGQGEAVLATYFDTYGPALAVPAPDPSELDLD